MTVTSLLNVIRKKCVDCTANQKKEITECRAKTCDLHPYRLEYLKYRGSGKS